MIPPACQTPPPAPRSLLFQIQEVEDEIERLLEKHKPLTTELAALLRPSQPRKGGGQRGDAASSATGRSKAVAKELLKSHRVGEEMEAIWDGLLMEMMRTVLINGE